MCIRDSAEADATSACLLEQGYKILVDLAAQHHLDDIHGFTIGVAPVSYTHLDVYKRQAPDFANLVTYMNH